MRTVRVQVGDSGETHTVIIQNRANSLGVKLLTCECGRSGWGWRGLQAAHARPAAIAGPATPAPATVVRTWRDKKWWYDPMYDNRQERREHLAYVWWLEGARKRRSRTLTRLGEQVLCRWYGHQESATVPGVCYFCQAKRGKRDRRWLPAPERDPDLRPGEGVVPTVVHGPILKPVTCRPHRYTSYHSTSCPYCDLESKR